jgi:HAMP domain-containing protein
MLPVFDHNAAYIWTIYLIGLAMPAGLLVYALFRARMAKRRLERLQAEMDR